MDERDPFHILIVEDDVEICDNLQDILELDDYRVGLAHTGAAGLDYAELSSVGAVLLDWKLPDTTALQLLSGFNVSVPAADIVIITGHGDLDSAIAAMRQGAVDYLLKPINAEALRTRLRRIAERQQMAQERARSVRDFRKLVEAAPSAIIILRTDGRIAYFSPFAERLTGWSSDDVLERDFSDTLLPPAVQTEFARKFEQIVKGHSVREFHGSLRPLDGTHRQMVWNARFLEDFEGRPAVLVIGQDVTDYRNAMERLVQSERLAAIGEAMAGLVHESRNALARSEANLRRLTRRLEGQTELLDLIEGAQRAHEDIARQFEEVRSYAAPLLLNFTSVDLGTLVEDAWAQLSPEREGREAALRVSSPEGNLQCDVDRNAMIGALRNILENALAASPDPVVIDVAFSETDVDGRPGAQLTIRDHGPGLSEEAAAKALDAFFTTKTRGTGLGLSIVKRIIDAHGGRFTIASVDSSDGTGAAATVILPKTQP